MLRIRVGIVILISTILMFAATAEASEQPPPEYSAHSITETADAKIEGDVYHAADKERREMSIEGKKTTMIIRKDKNLMWMLMPEEKVYMQMKLGASPDKGDLSGYEIKRTTVGTEKIDGIMTTKSKVIAKNKKDGRKFEGLWWTTKEGIPIRMDMHSVEKGKKIHIRTQLSDVKIGKQDPKLFEIPAGYTGMSMGMPDMKEMMGGKGDARDDGQEKSDDGDDKDGGFGLKNLFKMLK